MSCVISEIPGFIELDGTLLNTKYIVKVEKAKPWLGTIIFVMTGENVCEVTTSTPIEEVEYVIADAVKRLARL
jgi:hypothetical protein